jgi:hypothetical protein
MKIYALYKGDQFLIVGTKKELADYLKVKEKTISFYSSEVWKKRRNYNFDNCYLVIEVGNE